MFSCCCFFLIIQRTWLRFLSYFILSFCYFIFFYNDYYWFIHFCYNKNKWTHLLVYFCNKTPCWSLESMQALICYIQHSLDFDFTHTWRFGYLGLCCPSFDQCKPLAGAYFMVEHFFKARYLKLNRYVISESQGQLRPALCYWQEETFTVLLVRLLNSLHFRAGCPGRRNCQEAKRAILKRLWSPRFTTWGLPPRGSGEGTLRRTS